MSNYLTADELADMIDCKPNSYACMRRWLDANKWPYECGLTGFPKVGRAYHDARLAGQLAAAPLKIDPSSAGPDVQALLSKIGRMKGTPQTV